MKTFLQFVLALLIVCVMTFTLFGLMGCESIFEEEIAKKLNDQHAEIIKEKQIKETKTYENVIHENVTYWDDVK